MELYKEFGFAINNSIFFARSYFNNDVPRSSVKIAAFDLVGFSGYR